MLLYGAGVKQQEGCFNFHIIWHVPYSNTGTMHVHKTKTTGEIFILLSIPQSGLYFIIHITTTDVSVSDNRFIRQFFLLAFLDFVG